MAGASAQTTIEWASEHDLDWLGRHDPHINKRMMREKVARREIVVARKAGKTVGLLRYSLFLDWIPFIIFIFVLEDQRALGIGSRLVAFFEQQMRRRRFKLVMVSSRSDRHPQHFWRKLKYRDVGSLLLPDEPFELLFSKKL